MIHLVSAQNRHLYQAELEEFHRERTRQFVIERGWRLKVTDGGEYDDYDDEHASFLVGFSADGEIDVGCRIRPTLYGSVLGDVFPDLISPSEPPLREAGVFECTRYFSTARMRGRQGFEARSKLHIAMLEHVRDLQGHRLLGFVDLPLLTHLRRFSGLRIRPVGLPTPYEEGGVTIAFEIGVTDEDLIRARERLEIPTRQLFVAPAWLPEGADVLALANSATVLLSGPEAGRRAVTDTAREQSRALVFQPNVEALMSKLAEAST